MISLFQSIVQMDAPFNMIVLIVLFSCIAGVISTIAKETRKFVCHREEMELKREMLDRGMEAGEIDQVLRATTHHKSSSKARTA